MKRTPIPVVASLMVLMALARMPYGYYTLLKLGLSVACVYYIWQMRPLLAIGHRFVLGGLAVLYNPVIPVHLGNKGLWAVVNIATVLYFWALESGAKPASNSNEPAKTGTSAPVRFRRWLQ